MATQEPASKARPDGVIPMCVNAFEHIRMSNKQLQPLFPYTHPGAIIPCSICFDTGGPGSYMGYFVHENSVDEVAMVLASNGKFRSGDTFVGPRKHGVGFDSPVPFYMTMVNTQRQAEEGEQPESVTFQCEQCSAVLFCHEFSGSDFDRDQHFPPLPTTLGTFAAAEMMRDNPERLKCDQCGHVNRAFPIPIWGWERYVRNNSTIEKAYAALKEATQ